MNTCNQTPKYTLQTLDIKYLTLGPSAHVRKKINTIVILFQIQPVITNTVCKPHFLNISLVFKIDCLGQRVKY